MPKLPAVATQNTNLPNERSGNSDDSVLSVDDPYDVNAGTTEHYANAVLYDYEYRRRRSDVNWYRRTTKRLGPSGSTRVLDLACGSGRLTLPLARDGHMSWGIDLSHAMLLRARERAAKLGRAAFARVQFIRADMRQLALCTAFDVITMAFNAFEHLYTRVDVAACLRCVRALLTPSGVFLFDVQNPHLGWLARDPQKFWGRTRFRHPTTGERVEYTTNHEYDPVSQIAFIRLYYKTLQEDPLAQRTSVVRLAQRKFFPAELEALLHSNGFKVLERYGDFDDEPLTGDSGSQVIVCHLR